MSFPDVVKIIALYLQEQDICRAGVLLVEDALVDMPFAHLIPRPGEQDPDGIFRTDFIGVELYAPNRDDAVVTYRAIEEALLAGPIFNPNLGLVDSCELDETEADQDIADRDKYVLTFTIAAQSRS